MEAGQDFRVNSSCKRSGLPHPRIDTQKPLPGFVQPLQPSDIRAFLARIDPANSYGLRVIRLRQECLLHRNGITFAEYVIPGEIHLYALPASPWHLPFVPCASDRETFARHGGMVTVDTARNDTTVVWTRDSLQSFLLYEVLAHELGHHVLQHNKGKRQAQICRRADHEACADLHSRRMGKLRVDDLSAFAQRCGGT